MIRTYIFIICLSIISVFSYAQNNRSSSINGNKQEQNIFYHTIEHGQTVYAIATMYGVSVEDIYRLNPGSKEVIKVGFTLKIPQKKSNDATSFDETNKYTFHTIQPKETLYSVSVKYGVNGKSIMEANPGLTTATFTIGKTIRIPIIGESVTPSEQVSSPVKKEKKVKREIIEYTIEKKETMYRLCRKFNISSNELIKLNPELAKGVKAGMVIKVPVESTEEVIVNDTPVQETEIRGEKETNALLSTPKEIKRVNTVKAALLLPFMTSEITPSSATSRFIEYYEGMLLAIDSLRNRGYSIDLSVYDTGSGTKKVKEILKDDALKNANIIIGAVQNDQITPVAEFAQKNNIKYVIPFTSKNDDVLSNACIFQVNTPHSYLYSKAAQAGCDLFADYNIIILDIKDKEEKTDFIKAFRMEMKQRGIAYKDVTYNGETFATNIESMLSTDKPNVILPTSSSLDALNKIKSPLHMLAETKPEYRLTLFGYPEWQTYTRECLEDFYALNTYIYSNFYADNLSDNVHNFYSLYKNWYSKNLINTFPKYGMLGFDTGMFFFSAIHDYGSNFENSLNKMYYQSIQTGFNFERVNNWGGFINTSLFIVHYKNNYTTTRSEVKL